MITLSPEHSSADGRTINAHQSAPLSSPVSKIVAHAFKTLIIGISGPSCSGKTTLARLLRNIFASTGHEAFILHQDDYYINDDAIPIHEETGQPDWDCLESLDVGHFKAALQHIRATSTLPKELESKEDQNEAGKVNIDAVLIEDLQEQAKTMPKSTIAIIDGFLLFTPALEHLYSFPLMDIRLFLPISRELMINRRAARSGYVTLEGFWKDPPEYVERVVWPNYARYHSHLFKDIDNSLELDPDEVNEADIHIAPAVAMENMTSCLQWAWSVIEEQL